MSLFYLGQKINLKQQVPKRLNKNFSSSSHKQWAKQCASAAATIVKQLSSPLLYLAACCTDWPASSGKNHGCLKWSLCNPLCCLLFLLLLWLDYRGSVQAVQIPRLLRVFCCGRGQWMDIWWMVFSLPLLSPSPCFAPNDSESPFESGRAEYGYKKN